jgi:hypothetical protein
MINRIKELSKNLPFDLNLEDLKDGRFDISFSEDNKLYQEYNIIYMTVSKNNTKEIDSLIEILQIYKEIINGK